MKYTLNLNASSHSDAEAVLYPAFCKVEGKKTELVNSHWPKELKNEFKMVSTSKNFTGAAGETFTYTSSQCKTVVIIGLGDKKAYTLEALRKAAARAFHALKMQATTLAVQLDGFKKGNIEDTVRALTEGISLSDYSFDRHLSNKVKPRLTTVFLDSKEKKTVAKKLEKVLEHTRVVAESVNVARDFVNEGPNHLNSETFAKGVEADAKKNLKGVKIKVLGKPELKKEKMGCFLSVNAGSAFGPRLVHLSYTPKKATKNTKHVALVGKGLTFDTGGYSLKPSASMVNMKFDMAGAATMYAAFRTAVLMNPNKKVSCFLGMTDNAVNSLATMPDSIVKARNGKTVEILNTDAEGRLVLADVLDYACDQKPDVIIDAATLTGACLVALGSEVCAVLGNDQKLCDALLKKAKENDEYMWQLPIVDEFREDMKSPIADLKNIGNTGYGGTAKAAAFLENFIQEGVSWAHLDIAGVGDSQKHLPYCPSKGASGLMVRTVADYIVNG